MNINDFEKLYITNEEWSILKSFSRKPLQEFDKKIKNSPNIQCFIYRETSGSGSFAPYDGTCSLEQAGKNYVMYRKSKTRETIFDKIREWVIAGIAIAAFIKSFFF